MFRWIAMFRPIELYHTMKVSGPPRGSFSPFDSKADSPRGVVRLSGRRTWKDTGETNGLHSSKLDLSLGKCPDSSSPTYRARCDAPPELYHSASRGLSESHFCPHLIRIRECDVFGLPFPIKSCYSSSLYMNPYRTRLVCPSVRETSSPSKVSSRLIAGCEPLGVSGLKIMIW
jgi:hypothetical protein